MASLFECYYHIMGEALGEAQNKFNIIIRHQIDEKSEEFY